MRGVAYDWLESLMMGTTQYVGINYRDYDCVSRFTSGGRSEIAPGGKCVFGTCVMTPLKSAPRI